MKQCTYCGKEYADEASVCAIDEHPLRDIIPPSSGTNEPSMNAETEKKHSGIGIGSFVISIAVGILMVALLIIATFLNAQRVQGDRQYPGQMVVGLVAIALLGVDVIAVGLGIAAVCQSRKKRLFGILGLVFSSATLVGTIGLIIVGLTYASRFPR